jgi:hypothetical protein
MRRTPSFGVPLTADMGVVGGGAEEEGEGVEGGVWSEGCTWSPGEGGAVITAPEGEGGGGANEIRVLDRTFTPPPDGLVITTRTRPTWGEGGSR